MVAIPVCWDRCIHFAVAAVGLWEYVGITELSPTIVNDFIKNIIVHTPKKVNGQRTQRVQIFFNFIGEVDFPENIFS